MENALRYATALAAAVLALYSIFRRRSTIRDISGPPSPSWIFGHMRQLMLSSPYGAHEFRWLDVYGSVYTLKGCFGQDRLMVADPLALHPSSHSALALVAATLTLTLTLTSTLTLTFTPTLTRSRSAQVTEQRSSNSHTHSRLALDLGEDFVANNIEIVQSETHILADAIGSYLPAWVWRAAIYLPTTGAAVARKERFLAKQVGGRIVREKIDAAKQGLEMNNDLFSLLQSDQQWILTVNPNPSDNTKTLSVDDIVAQIALILIAGQETTARISLKANALAFGLLELARHPDFQDKLRAEIYSNLGANATDMAYENIPLLNAFLKETIRLYPAVPQPERLALEDTAIPLGESITTSKGERISHIPVRKGQVVTLAIAAYQRLASPWGMSPHEFNPSRWLKGETNQGDAVGPYANLLSFLGGPKTCLGFPDGALRRKSASSLYYPSFVGKSYPEVALGAFIVWSGRSLQAKCATHDCVRLTSKTCLQLRLLKFPQGSRRGMQLCWRSNAKNEIEKYQDWVTVLAAVLESIPSVNTSAILNFPPSLSHFRITCLEKKKKKLKEMLLTGPA
ncbi:cytochrome P450 [Mycena olivaceomarginata]|nr:cytochrome P450 [Mycena olivaceomarginata]